MREQANETTQFDTETVYFLTEKDVSVIVWVSLIGFLVDKTTALAIMNATGESYREQERGWSGTIPVLTTTIVEMLLDVPEFASFFGGNIDAIGEAFVPIVRQNIQLASIREAANQIIEREGE